MEKLQAALAKAREKREGGPIRSGRPLSTNPLRSSPRQTAHAAAVDQRWAQLELLEPSTKRMRQSRIYAGDVTSAEAAHFDILRTKLVLEMRRHGWSRVAITSATAGCGKTTTACNLIASLGRQPEIRAGLVDFDLRRPSVAKFLGATGVPSFTSVLTGETAFADQARKLTENTFVSLSEKPERDPAQVLLQSRTAEMLDEIQTTYAPDILLFDLPPVMMADEARGLLKLVDAALIVAAAGKTTVEQLDDCERDVASYTSVAGIVLNKCEHLDENYEYSY